MRGSLVVVFATGALIGCGARTASFEHFDPSPVSTAENDAAADVAPDIAVPDTAVVGMPDAVVTMPDTHVETCPPSLPTAKTSCALVSGTSCTFENPCGTFDTATCISGAWSVTEGACPCPTKRPPFDSACPAEGQHCSWPSPCGSGSVDTATCEGLKWNVTLATCGHCPLFTPSSGTKCSGFAGCFYTFFTTVACHTSCACDGASWSCAATICDH